MNHHWLNIDPLMKKFQERAMSRLGWAGLPEATREWYRADGGAICSCGMSYREHPYDLNDLAYDGSPYMHVLCNGDRVKL